MLRAAIMASPRNAGLHHALGLALVRQKHLEKALDELRQATEYDPDQAEYAYVYAIALNSFGRTNEAMIALRANLKRHPNDRDTLMALIQFSRNSGDIASALGYANQLAVITPYNSEIDTLISNLRQQLKGQSIH